MSTWHMAETIQLQQADFSFLFWLDYGRVREVPAVIAQRLLAHDLVRPSEPMLGAQVAGRTACFITVSELGRDLLVAVCEGRDSRFLMIDP